MLLRFSSVLALSWLNKKGWCLPLTKEEGEQVWWKKGVTCWFILLLNSKREQAIWGEQHIALLASDPAKLPALCVAINCILLSFLFVWNMCEMKREIAKTSTKDYTNLLRRWTGDKPVCLVTPSDTRALLTHEQFHCCSNCFLAVIL